MPGIVEKNGFLTTAGAITALYGVNLKDTLEQRTNLPIQILNDANAAALAEHWIGSATTYQTFISLVLGTGVGGAFVIDGKLYTGAHSRSGEFGWMILKDIPADVESGTLNDQGATVFGLLRLYNDRLKALGKGSPEWKTQKPQVIFEKAKQGDKIATEVLHQYFYSLAVSLINIIVSFDPEAIILGGGISENKDFQAGLYQEIDVLHHAHASIHPLVLPPIKIAKLGNDAGMIGAAYEAMRSGL